MALNILHLSDLHIGKSSLDLKSLACAISMELAKRPEEKIRQIVVTGDTFDGTFHKAKTDAQKDFFKNAKDFFEELIKQIYDKQKVSLSLDDVLFVPGNHEIEKHRFTKDTKIQSLFENFKSFLKFFYDTENPEGYNMEYLSLTKEIENEKVIIVGFNSAYLDEKEDFGYIQIEQLDNEISKIKEIIEGSDEYSIVVLLHHHFQKFEKRNKNLDRSILRNNETFLNPFRDYNIVAILHGHKHESVINRVDINDARTQLLKIVHAIGCGTTNKDDVSVNNFNIVTICTPEDESILQVCEYERHQKENFDLKSEPIVVPRNNMNTSKQPEPVNTFDKAEYLLFFASKNGKVSIEFSHNETEVYGAKFVKCNEELTDIIKNPLSAFYVEIKFNEQKSNNCNLSDFLNLIVNKLKEKEWILPVLFFLPYKEKLSDPHCIISLFRYICKNVIPAKKVLNVADMQYFLYNFNDTDNQQLISAQTKKDSVNFRKAEIIPCIEGDLLEKHLMVFHLKKDLISFKRVSDFKNQIQKIFNSLVKISTLKENECHLSLFYLSKSYKYNLVPFCIYIPQEGCKYYTTVEVWNRAKYSPKKFHIGGAFSTGEVVSIYIPDIRKYEETWRKEFNDENYTDNDYEIIALHQTKSQFHCGIPLSLGEKRFVLCFDIERVSVEDKDSINSLEGKIQNWIKKDVETTDFIWNYINIFGKDPKDCDELPYS